MIRTHSTAKLVLKSQFVAIQRALGLNTSTGAQSTLAAFYQRLNARGENLIERVLAASPRLTQEEIGTKQAILSEEHLLVTAILLSAGSPLDKSAALYHVFDEGFLNSLSSSTLHDLFTLLFRTSIDDLPVLSSQPIDTEVQMYLEKAHIHLEYAVKAVLQAIMEKQTSLTIEEFAKRMARYRAGELTSPEGIRAFAKKCGEKKTTEEEENAE